MSHSLTLPENEWSNLSAQTKQEHATFIEQLLSALENIKLENIKKEQNAENTEIINSIEAYEAHLTHIKELLDESIAEETESKNRLQNSSFNPSSHDSRKLQPKETPNTQTTQQSIMNSSNSPSVDDQNINDQNNTSLKTSYSKQDISKFFHRTKKTDTRTVSTNAKPLFMVGGIGMAVAIVTANPILFAVKAGIFATGLIIHTSSRISQAIKNRKPTASIALVNHLSGEIGKFSKDNIHYQTMNDLEKLFANLKIEKKQLSYQTRQKYINAINQYITILKEEQKKEKQNIQEKSKETTDADYTNDINLLIDAQTLLNNTKDTTNSPNK